MNEYYEFMMINNVIDTPFDELYKQIIDVYKYQNGISKFNSLYKK